ncbi:MAG TPA: hypothetical protein PLJ27_19325 [Polyangiaceae bacterium]|nr:hypothetical protein [Polyangiaceae bacterium]HNZ23211.1 hypothetical protein [Polyangiaceae bacterium]HOD24477.1 hypothetical protein [Polyangiaceae bacterium]HOE49753.1 hypothetical protein [Polyangiaceae bacterium]HOH00769.1 hypothetical protein [Polyangiaceae bacterium]
MLFALLPSRLQRLARLARRSFHATTQEAQALRGRWVALDHCHYDEGDSIPSSGRVVDSDSDLGELVSRLRLRGGHRCVIVRCEHGCDWDPQTGVYRSRRATHDLTPAA